MIYLDHAATTGTKPLPVRRAGARARTAVAAKPGRSGSGPGPLAAALGALGESCELRLEALDGVDGCGGLDLARIGGGERLRLQLEALGFELCFGCRLVGAPRGA